MGPVPHSSTVGLLSLESANIESFRQFSFLQSGKTAEDQGLFKMTTPYMSYGNPFNAALEQDEDAKSVGDSEMISMGTRSVVVESTQTQMVASEEGYRITNSIHPFPIELA